MQDDIHRPSHCPSLLDTIVGKAAGTCSIANRRSAAADMLDSVCYVFLLTLSVLASVLAATSEARLSALRVRVDGQDGRLAGLGERAEAAGQQAQDVARQVSLQQREDILSETDCQLRIVRQRMDTLSELCE
ncbi:unnamed protein product, partial [Prorocentrum cordatum]